MNHHRVTVALAEPDEDGWRSAPTIDFTCDAPEDAGCRTYPDCTCESWSAAERGLDDMGHPFVAGQECVLVGWFDNTEPEYAGPDSEDGVPTIAHAGPIVAEYEDGYVQWYWAD